MSKILRDIVTSFSLVNVALIPVWNQLNHDATASTNAYLAALFLFFSAGITVFLVGNVLYRWAGNWGAVVARLSLLIALGIVTAIVSKGWLESIAYDMKLKFGMIAFRATEVLILVMALALILAFRRRLFQLARLGLIVLSPFCLVTIGHAVWIALVADPHHAIAEMALPSRADLTRHRVLFILFDELDYGVAVERRPSHLSMPEFDRLRQESFFATHAYPPGNATAISMPAMMTGHLVARAYALPDDIGLQFLDGTRTTLSATNTLIHELHIKNYTTLRLDPILPDGILDRTGKDKRVLLPALSSLSLFEAAVDHLRLLAFLLPMSGTLPEKLIINRDVNAARLKASLAIGTKLAQEGDADFIYLHFMLPHLPVFYSPASGTFTADADGDYVDNVAGVDKVIGQIRQAMETSGSWNYTTIIMTGDHWWRYGVASGIVPSDHRIPFIVKLAGQAQPHEYKQEFNTVLFKDMVSEILMSPATSSADLAAWIDAHRTFGESPLTKSLK